MQPGNVIDLVSPSSPAPTEIDPLSLPDQPAPGNLPPPPSSPAPTGKDQPSQTHNDNEDLPSIQDCQSQPSQTHKDNLAAYRDLPLSTLPYRNLTNFVTRVRQSLAAGFYGRS